MALTDSQKIPSKPLVVQSPRNPFEGFWGWLLRLSELNAYSGPNQVLGLVVGQRTTDDHEGYINAFAALTGEPVGEIRRLIHSERRSVLYPGFDVPAKAIDFATPKVCPECLRSKRMCYAAWDLKLWSACPVHRTRMILKCSACNTPINWQRRGIDYCSNLNCAMPLSECNAEPANSDEIALVEFLREFVDGSNSIRNTDLKLINVSKSSLDALYLSHSIARIFNQNYGYSAASEVGRFFRNWPQSFFDLISNYCDNSRGEQNLEKLFPSLYRNIIPSATSFMPAYFRSIMTDTFHRAINNLDHEARPNFRSSHNVKWISSREARRRLGVSITVLQSLREGGLLTSKRAKSNKGHLRYHMILSEDVNRLIQDGPRYGVKNARESGYDISLGAIASELGLQKKYVIGIIANSELPSFRKSLKTIFINADQRKLLIALIKPRIILDEKLGNKYVSISKAMKFGPHLTASNLFEEIKDGSVNTYASDSISYDCKNIFVKKSDIRLLSNRAGISRGVINGEDARALLSVHSNDLNRLINSGYIVQLGRVRGREHVLCLNSVNEFNNTYYSAARLSKETNFSLRAVRRILNSEGAGPSIVRAGTNTVDFWERSHPAVQKLLVRIHSVTSSETAK